MKKILITLLTIFFAYILSYYTTDAHKKQDLFDFGGSNLLYKISTLISGETDTTDAYAVFQRGLEFLDYQNYDAAIKDFDRALELDSNFIFETGTIYEYFRIYIEAKDTTKQIKYLEDFIKKETYNYEALNKLAAIYILLKNNDKAETYLQNSIRINSDYNNEAFFQLAKINYSSNDYSEALNLVNKAININSYFIEYFNLRRLIYIKQNDFQLAKADYDYILSQNADYFPDYFEKGKQAEIAKNYQGAVENYKLALISLPNNREILNKRGWAYFAIEKYDSAYFDFDTIVKYYPDKVSYFNKAYVEDYLDKIEEAIQDYSIVIGYDSTDYRSFMNRGYEYYRLKKYTNAKKDYTKSIELKPDYHQHYYNRGLLHNKFKRYKLAIEDYKNALKNSPNNANITYDIALAYDKLNDKKIAIEWYNKYLAIAGENDLTKKEYAIKRIEKLSK